MAAVATGRFGQPRLVERRNLHHVNQFDLLNQQLSDAVAAVHDDGGDGIEVNQRHLDFAAVSGVDCAGAVDDGQTQPRSQTGPGVHQPYHAVRDGCCDPGGHQGPLSRRKFDVLGAEKVDAGVTAMGAAGQREAGVQTDNRKSGRHGAKDYP